MSMRKGDLLPVAVAASTSPQPPSKNSPRMGLLPQPRSSLSVAALSFAAGAILMLVLSLAAPWQGVGRGGLMGQLVRRTEFGSDGQQPGILAPPDGLAAQEAAAADAAAARTRTPAGAAVRGTDAVQQAHKAAAATAAAAAVAAPDCPEAPKCAEAPRCPLCPKPQACPKPQPCPRAPVAVPPLPPPRIRMPWSPLLSHREVQRGLSYYGTGERLRAVVEKLHAGQPIKAFTLGGSVTKGQGASGPEAGFPTRLFDFINATWPHRDHVLVNKGIGGTSSGVYSACAEQMVGQDPDLVIVDFTVNEKPNEPFTSSHRQGYEQLLRKLLRLPGRPAVVQMHHYAWWRSAGDGVKQGLFYYPQAEQQLTVFSHYYDVPSISLRAAVYPLMQNGVPGFQADKVWEAGKKTTSGIELPVADKKDRHLYFYNDRTHPNDRGHQMIAELLASLLIRAAAEQREGWQAAVAEAAGWAPEQKWPAGRDPLALPPPMIPGNADVPTSLCAIQEGFKDIVVAHSEGFKYQAERPKEASFVGQKWAWTASKPGAWAELEFDSRDEAAAGSGAESGNGSTKAAEVYLTHLKGYEGFGTARIKCVAGCRCQGKGMTLDGTWEQQATLMQIHKFQVTQHEKCRVRVTVDKEAGEVPQDGHKVSLTAVMVSHFPIRLTTYEDQAEQVATLV